MPSTPNRRPAEYKQMALDTAVRNPERYLSILQALNQYDGTLLNEPNLLTMLTELYKLGLVRSPEVDVTLPDSQLKEQIVKVDESRNADGGFPRGYASRFWTYMRTPSEFGLIYARFNQSLRVSPLVKRMLEGKLDEQEVFALQAFRGNRRSPYRNVSNDYNFFKYIFELLRLRGSEGHQLSVEQLTLAMCSRDGNVDEINKTISTTKFSGPEDVYAYVREHYNVRTSRKTTTRDYPDVIMRMLVISGMISIRYTGVKLISLNKDKISFFSELMTATPDLSNDAKENEKVFYEEMNTWSDAYDEIILNARETDLIEGSEYTSKLLTIIKQYSLEQAAIASELEKMGMGVKSSLFKEMPEPVKLEFYVSLLVAFVYGEELEIRPNYKVDHEGKPYSHAPGGGGDIDIFTDKLYWLIEVTLIRNRQQQLNSETNTVFRHMTTNDEFSGKAKKYLSFVAPLVHRDTLDYFEHATVMNRNYKIIFGSYNINDFIKVTEGKSNFGDMENQTKTIVNRFISNLQR